MSEAVSIILDESQARDAVIALEKHAAARDEKGHDSSAGKYQDIADTIRDCGNAQLGDGLFDHRDTGNSLHEERVEQIVHRVFRKMRSNPRQRSPGN